ncbi:MAG: 16S rRNA (cytidine(1402)-2'-O)-methyltransferase [Candidatus Taylorbacteria bacterium]
MTTFSVVGTPIGNLEDITLRALNVLRNADLVLCEDTRMTKRLLDRHDIHVKTMSYHMHSKLSRVEEIVGILRSNKSVIQNVVLVSDAGTPSISDPGSELISKIRVELHNEIVSGALKIEAIPGPSALTAAISIAGVPCAEFTFLGFLPHKKGRQTLFTEIMSAERTMIFYESPHRIMKTLKMINDQCSVSGESADDQSKKSEVRLKKITICRELTKIFEEVVNGTAAEVFEYFTAHPDKVRGEFVVIVSNT